MPGMTRRIDANFHSDVELRRALQRLDQAFAHSDAEMNNLALSAPMTPVHLLGDFVDNFDLTDGLTGPYQSGLSNLTAVANGYLTLSGTQTATGRGSMGSARGTFLPLNGVWTITLKITGVTSTTFPREVGFGLSSTVFADGGTWNYPTTRIYFSHQTPTPLYRIYWLDQGGGGILEVGALPTRAEPIYLRCAQTLPGDVRTLTWSYKYESDGSYTVLDTNTPSGWLTGDIDVGVLFGTSGNGTVSAEFDSLTVEYVPESTGGAYAFIPTVEFTVGSTTYKQWHLYRKRRGGRYHDTDVSAGSILDNAPIVVLDRDLGVLKKWDSATSDWVRIYTLPTLHPISGSTFHSAIPGVAENDIVSADANGLPQKAFTPGTDVSNVVRPDGAGGLEVEDLPHSETTGQTTDDHHDISHAHDGADGSGTVAHSDTTGKTIVSHDTTGTGAQLTTLTDSSNADALHKHAIEVITTSGTPGQLVVAQVGGTMAMEDPDEYIVNNSRSWGEW